MRLIKPRFVLGALLACGIAAPALAQEVSLSMSSVWAGNLIFTSDVVEKFVKRVNDQGKGKVQIRFLGGPEAIPARQQPDALRRGVVDILLCAATHLSGIVPEADALSGTNITPSEARAKGGIDLLNSLGWNPKLNAHLLGWIQSGTGNHVYLVKEPPRRADGVIDLTGVKIRSSPTHQAQLAGLGATTMVINSAEMLTAMERGLVEGTGYPAFGVPDVGFQRFTKFRVEPGFLEVPVSLQVNLQAWNKLSPEARALVQKLAQEYEEESRAYFQKYAETEQRMLAKDFGMKVVEHKGDAAKKYRAIAYDALWSGMAKASPDNAAKIKQIFYDPAR